MSLETSFRLMVGAFLIAANGFFVATEFALTRLRQFPQSDFHHHPGLKRAWKMTDELEIYLTGCQVGITFTSILLGIVVEPAVTAALVPLLSLTGISQSATHAIGLVTGLVLLNLIHTIWAEQTPTYLGIEKAKLVARFCAIPHYWWTRLVYPLLLVGDYAAKWTLAMFGIEMSRSWIEDQANGKKSETSERVETPITSRAELINQMGRLLKRGKLPQDRRDEVLQTVLIDQIATGEIMVPREQINAIYVKDSFDDIGRMIGQSKHTRYPLIGEDLDDVKGFIYLPEVFTRLKDLQQGHVSIEDISCAPMTVDYDLPVSDLVDRFQEQKQEIAVVKDEGQTVGLITITDAFESIIGDAEDPLDELRQRPISVHPRA